MDECVLKMDGRSHTEIDDARRRELRRSLLDWEGSAFSGRALI
jgi:hypothetical protein